MWHSAQETKDKHTSSGWAAPGCSAETCPGGGALQRSRLAARRSNGVAQRIERPTCRAGLRTTTLRCASRWLCQSQGPSNSAATLLSVLPAVTKSTATSWLRLMRLMPRPTVCSPSSPLQLALALANGKLLTCMLLSNCRQTQRTALHHSLELCFCIVSPKGEHERSEYEVPWRFSGGFWTVRTILIGPPGIDIDNHIPIHSYFTLVSALYVSTPTRGRVAIDEWAEGIIFCCADKFTAQIGRLGNLFAV